MATAPYRVIVSNAARKEALALPRDVQQRIRPVIAALADEPRPHGSEKLKGSERFYRVRVGDYRVIYHVEDADLTVTVTRIKHRRDVYRP
jgi:mRNA interferase RelE/StbE